MDLMRRVYTSTSRRWAAASELALPERVEASSRACSLTALISAFRPSTSRSSAPFSSCSSCRRSSSPFSAASSRSLSASSCSRRLRCPSTMLLDVSTRRCFDENVHRPHPIRSMAFT